MYNEKMKIHLVRSLMISIVLYLYSMDAKKGKMHAKKGEMDV